MASLPPPLLALLCSLFPLPSSLLPPAGAAPTGSIRATIRTEELVISAWAIQTRFTKNGAYENAFPAAVEGDHLVAKNLPLEGRYRLRFQTKSGFIEGWDAVVPDSDYVEEQPLSGESKRTIIEKLAKAAKRDFSDRSVILDIQGNIQNAAVLVTRLRTRPFVGGGYQPGEWVWRVEHWQWEDPLEHTWTPNQQHPFYTLVRKRLYERDYKALATLYARHLGGIELGKGHPDAQLGTIRLPRPKPGASAIGPDGTPVKPIILKPWNPSTLAELIRTDDKPEGAEP